MKLASNPREVTGGIRNSIAAVEAAARPVNPPQIGYCCITLFELSDKGKVPELACGSATVAYVSSLGLVPRTAYLRRLVWRNLLALERAVERLALEPERQRMMRITSGLLPLFTHQIAYDIYNALPFANAWRDRLAAIGIKARLSKVRLSFHPGQYCVLNSVDEHKRVAALKEFEYHTTVATALGYYGCNPLDGRIFYQRDTFAINVHGGGGQFDNDIDAINSWTYSWRRLSNAAKQLITLENDEFAWSFERIGRLCTRLGIRMVPDVHHHWVASYGTWIDPCSAGALAAKATWDGFTPKVHVSAPLPDHFSRGWKDEPAPLRVGLRPPSYPEGVLQTKLREHSNYIYHPGLVEYLGRWYDAGWSLQVESKAKNLARDALYASLFSTQT